MKLTSTPWKDDDNGRKGALMFLISAITDLSTIDVTSSIVESKTEWLGGFPR